MQGIDTILNVLGSVCLLLWGVRMVRTGVTRAYGDRLKNFIEHRVGNRVSAFMAGGVATAILGSGTAMALIVVGLAAAGAINTALGLAVLLGADVGSAIVSSVFASGSNLALWASPLLIFAGYIVHSWSAELRPHNLGRALIGLGLMLLSLTLIKQASAPLSTASFSSASTASAWPRHSCSSWWPLPPRTCSSPWIRFRRPSGSPRSPISSSRPTPRSRAPMLSPAWP